jgi:branched-chain amino acid transport system permease protein
MVVIGGIGHFWAVILSALAFTVIPDLLLFSKDLRMVLYGVVLIVAVLGFPKGLAGIARQKAVDGWRKRLAARARQQKATEAGHA